MKIKGRASKILAISSVLGGLTAVFEILPLDIPFPPYPRITYDPTGIPIILSLLLTGFIPSTYTALVGVSAIFFRGNIFGGIFKLIAELSSLAGLSLLLKRNIYLAVLLSLATRVVAMTLANYSLLPLFYGVPSKVVLALLAPIALFNLTQGALNIGVAYLIYMRTPHPLKERLV